MKLSIISDLHLGDENSVLIARSPVTNEIEIKTEYYEKLCDSFYKKEECKENETRYLILLGDILDFAVAGYEESYEIAIKFFKDLKKKNLFDEIIYVPGNHDFELWHIIEYEVNVINRLKNCEPVRHFKWSVPGIIDDRDGKGRFDLLNVREKKGGNTRYGGLYLDYLTGCKENETTTFNIAYPNLYLATDHGSFLITHGHYFKVFWSLLGDASLKVFGDDLIVGKEYRIDERVAVNFPFSQLSSSGTGQAGPLSGLVNKIQRDVKDKDPGGLAKLEKYVKNLLNFVKTEFTKGGVKFGLMIFSRVIRKKIMKELRKSKPDRYNEEWLADGSKVRENLIAFINECADEIAIMKNKLEVEWPFPTTMIFGHTHIPWKPNDNKEIPIPGRGMLKAWNTGGWLFKEINGKKTFKGAEVFRYSTEYGFSSVSIR